MKDLVDTTEMYLRTIYELEEESIPPLRARIADRLEQSGPTVSQTVARMERDGLLTIAEDRSLKLTDKGRELATAVMRKHRLAECLLTEVVGLPWEQIHDEACRWEHVMSEDVERRLVQVLDESEKSPFGNPIPGLEELGAEASEDTQQSSIRASDIRGTEDMKVRVASFNEIIQTETALMNQLLALGITPGTELSLSSVSDGIELHVKNGSVLLPHDFSHALRVEVLEED